MTASHTGTPPMATRALGVVGILGGLVLLAAFVVEIPSALNTVRLVLFCAGAIAVAVAVHGRHATVSRRLALAGAIPVIAANGWYIAWLLLAIGRERPFAGDFGLVGFWAGLAFWLADAWFGLVALRLGVVWRPAAFILVVGSLMATTGMDRLELTSQANPTIFAPIALAGVALNGFAWVLLGIDVVMAFPRPGWQPVPDGERAAFVAGSGMIRPGRRGPTTDGSDGPLPQTPLCSVMQERATRLTKQLLYRQLSRSVRAWGVIRLGGESGGKHRLTAAPSPRCRRAHLN